VVVGAWVGGGDGVGSVSLLLGGFEWSLAIG
jgi:hypothetical protein